MKINNLVLFILVFTVFAACKNNTAKQSLENNSTKDSFQEKKEVLETVFQDKSYQLTGVAVSKDNRVFINYPFWLDAHTYSVVEVKNGKPVSYPNEEWNSFKKGESGQDKFVCVQAVVTDDKGYLWVVDAAGIGLGKVYKESNKVVKINLSTNQIEHIYRFPSSVAGENVYLNDIRVDNQNGFAYLTNSNTGGIVILNIITGESRMVLNNTLSVKSDPTYHFSPLGTELKKGDGSVLKVNSDGIALTPDKTYLYYKPLTDNKLYRIKTELLRDFNMPQKTLNDKVEDLGTYVTTDGMIFDTKGNLYFGDLEKNSIVKITPDLKMTTVVEDAEKLIWPDSYSISNDNYLYITSSQIHLMPWFHNGEDKFEGPFSVYRIKI